MLCTGCGKDVPFVGDVCPFCHRNKTKDQAYVVYAFILGPLFAFIGFGIFQGWGIVGGFLLGCLIASAISGAGKKSKPPEVSIKNTAVSDIGKSTHEQRLLKLKDLFDKKLISESEYNKKRAEILDGF